MTGLMGASAVIPLIVGILGGVYVAADEVRGLEAGLAFFGPCVIFGGVLTTIFALANANVLFGAWGFVQLGAAVVAYAMLARLNKLSRQHQRHA